MPRETCILIKIENVPDNADDVLLCKNIEHSLREDFLWRVRAALVRQEPNDTDVRVVLGTTQQVVERLGL